MKLAVISDIHCNIIALQLAVEDLKKYEVDGVAFLGDYITDGENENEILKIIRKNADYVILGNREKYILEFSPERSGYNDYKMIATTHRNLRKESVDYLKTLKDIELLDLAGYRVLMIHGEGRSYKPENRAATYDGLIAQFDFDVCLFGHSHLFIDEIYKGKRFINPGSVGQPADGPAYKYCIVDFNNDVDVTLRAFNISDTYDAFLKSYISSNYYKVNPAWGNLFLDCLKDGKDYYTPFVIKLKNALENAADLDESTFNSIWNRTYLEYRKGRDEYKRE